MLKTLEAVRRTPRMGHLRACILAGLLCELAPIQAARAQDDSAADIAAARALAVDGLKLADAGRCADAIDKLARAEKLHHAPIVLGRLGECQIAQGKIVDGTENLRRMLREPMPANPQPGLVKAHTRAQAVLDAAKPKIAGLTISVKGPHENLSVTVDGQAVPPALLDAERPSDPGEHVIEASAPGYLTRSARVALGPGEKQSISLELPVDPDHVAAAPPAGAGANASASEGGENAPAPGGAAAAGGGAAAVSLDRSAAGVARSPDRTAAYVALAAGGAGLVVGAVAGAIAVHGKNQLTGVCHDNVCPSSSTDELDSARRAGSISTVGFAVGATGLVLGTVLFFTSGSSGRAELPASNPPKSRARSSEGLHAQLVVGPGQIGLAGRF